MRYRDYLPSFFSDIRDFSSFGQGIDAVGETLFASIASFPEEVSLSETTLFLDRYAELLGEKRNGKSDEEFRTILLSRFSGRLPFTLVQLKRRLSYLFPEDETDVVLEQFALEITLPDVSEKIVSGIFSQLRQMIPANLTLKVLAGKRRKGNLYCFGVVQTLDQIEIQGGVNGGI